LIDKGGVMQIGSRGNIFTVTLSIAFLTLSLTHLHAQSLDSFINSAVRSITNSLQQPPPPPPSPVTPLQKKPAEKKAASQSSAVDVATVQAILNSLGYDAGPVDGVFGRKTRQALNSFERDRGLSQSASVNQATIQMLAQATQNAARTAPPDQGQNAAPARLPGVQAVASDNLQGLKAPPDGVNAWDIGAVDGLPAFTNDQQLAALIDLIVLGQVPDTLERNECALMTLFFTREAREPYSELHNCASADLVWRGSDEFARSDMRHRFYAEQVPQLTAVAPKLPLSVVIVDDIRLDEFNATTSSFPLQARSRLLEQALGTSIGERLRFSNVSSRRDQPPTIAAAAALPILQLPMADATQARNFIGEVNSWVYSPGSALPKTNQRTMKRVAVVELVAFDPVVRRLDVRLNALSLYDLELSRKFYDFPLEASGGSVVAGGAGDGLIVPEPVELDKTYLALRQIQNFGEDTSPEVWETLVEIIRGRDSGYYQMQERSPASVQTYGEKDARRPFFAKRDYNMPDNRWPLFREWAQAYAHGLPETVEHRRSYTNIDFDPKRSYSFTALTGSRAGDHPAIAEIDLQPDQLLSAEGVLIALPNRTDLFTLEVPGSILKPYEGKTMQLRMLLHNQPRSETIVIQDRPILVIRLDPASLRLELDGIEIAARSFDDIPTLDSGFVAASEGSSAERSIFDVARPISGDVINLVLASALDPADPRYGGLVTQRWHLERQEGVLGGSFFVIGKREPTEQEAQALAQDFAAWAGERVPPFPGELTLTFDFVKPKEAVPGAFEWESLACMFSALTQEDSFRIATNLRTNRAELLRREQAMAGMATWTADDDVRITAGEVEKIASHFVTRIGCYQHTISPVIDPVPLYASIPSLLPTPPEGATSAELRLQVKTLNYTSDRPQYLDLLPPELQEHLIEGRKQEPGDYIKLEAEWFEVVYRDATGNELTRHNPDPAFTLEDALSRFWGEVEQHDMANSGEPYGHDIVGIQVGMSFADAEAIIRNHMPVGRVLEGVRAFDGSIEAATIRPATSGKLFISESGREFIALLDEAPAIKGQVLVAWRRLYLEPNQLQEGEAITSLTTKYGTPSMQRTVELGIRNFWATPAGNDCGGNYTYGGQRFALSAAWSDGAQQMQMLLPDGQHVPDAVLPGSILDPLNPGKEAYINCGPVFTAELSFDASRMLKAGYPTTSLDWIEQIISDVGPYIEAFKENRRSLQSSDPSNSTGNTVGVKF